MFSDLICLTHKPVFNEPKLRGLFLFSQQGLEFRHYETDLYSPDSQIANCGLGDVH
jgi:hypothetical protein